jgi:hypothetical protein
MSKLERIARRRRNPTVKSDSGGTAQGATDAWSKAEDPASGDPSCATDDSLLFTHLLC